MAAFTRCRADVSYGLIEDVVDFFLGSTDRLPIDDDFVLGANMSLWCRYNFAIDLHLLVEDEFFTGAPRGDTCRGHYFAKSLFHNRVLYTFRGMKAIE